MLVSVLIIFFLVLILYQIFLASCAGAEGFADTNASTSLKNIIDQINIISPNLTKLNNQISDFSNQKIEATSTLGGDKSISTSAPTQTSTPAPVSTSAPTPVSAASNLVGGTPIVPISTPAPVSTSAPTPVATSAPTPVSTSAPAPVPVPVSAASNLVGGTPLVPVSTPAPAAAIAGPVVPWKASDVYNTGSVVSYPASPQNNSKFIYQYIKKEKGNTTGPPTDDGLYWSLTQPAWAEKPVVYKPQDIVSYDKYFYMFMGANVGIGPDGSGDGNSDYPPPIDKSRWVMIAPTKVEKSFYKPGALFRDGPVFKYIGGERGIPVISPNAREPVNSVAIFVLDPSVINWSGPPTIYKRMWVVRYGEFFYMFKSDTPGNSKNPPPDDPNMWSVMSAS
jgi:hypothetical protein